MRAFKWIIFSLIAIALAGGGYGYWRYTQRYRSTDDAYVGAHVVEIAAQVSGPVARLFVHDNQYVHKDLPLFDIDPRPFQLAVAQDQARLALTEQSVAAAQAAVRAAQAQVTERRVQLQNARVNAARVERLAREKYLSSQAADNAATAVKSAAAALAAAKADLKQAIVNLGKPGNQNARIEGARAALARARLNLQYTYVTAPTSGWVTRMSLRPGNMVQSGTPLFALISDAQFWVDANFKETDLQSIRPGQPAVIHVDMYPDHRFRGIVESISGGSGAAFSLLPPQNATGNWVKVTQRVPVRVRILDPSRGYPLRVGTSATVTVDTARPTH